jgi:hypothetical protein
MPRAYLEPVSAGQTRFRLQGLVPDARGIAVGREALIVFDTLDRLVAFLGAYSDEASLDDLMPSLTLEHGRHEAGAHAFLLRCAASDGYALDRLARLATHVSGQVYTGNATTFVRWRTRRAPFGNDLALAVSELGGVGGDEILAVDQDRFLRFREQESIDPVELIQRLELRRVPVNLDRLDSEPEAMALRELVLILVAPALASRVIHYLWRLEVAMGAARLVLGDDSAPALLLRLRQPSLKIVAVLAKIPGIEILAPVSSRAAVEIGFRHPINLTTASVCLPGEDMYLFRGRANRIERLDGAPRFVDARHLIRSGSPLVDAELEDAREHAIAPLAVRLELRRSNQVREPRGCLVPWDAAESLRRLIYLLPPSVLATARLAPLREGLLILAGGFVGGASNKRVAQSGNTRVRSEANAAMFIAQGTRLCEASPGVLVPEGYDLRPKPRPELCRQLLGLEDDDYAVFLGDSRAPLRVRAEQVSALDTSLLARIIPHAPELVEISAPPLLSGKIDNARLGRFALWGFRGSAEDV